MTMFDNDQSTLELGASNSIDFDIVGPGRLLDGKRVSAGHMALRFGVGAINADGSRAEQITMTKETDSMIALLDRLAAAARVEAHEMPGHPVGDTQFLGLQMSRWFNRQHPSVRQAMRTDGALLLQMQTIERALRHLMSAMQQNGVDEETRRNVIQTALTGEVDGDRLAMIDTARLIGDKASPAPQGGGMPGGEPQAR